MRGKISRGRECSPMYTMGMMSPVGARYLVHGLRVIRMRRETPSRADLAVRFFAISGHRQRHVTPSVARESAPVPEVTKNIRIPRTWAVFYAREWDSHSGGAHRRTRFGRASGWRCGPGPKIIVRGSFALCTVHQWFQSNEISQKLQLSSILYR